METEPHLTNYRAVAPREKRTAQKSSIPPNISRRPIPQRPMRPIHRDAIGSQPWERD